MANPRKFSEKIALHNQKQAEETAAFEKIMREVSDATNKVNSSSRCVKTKPSPESAENDDTSLRPTQNQQCLGTFRSGSLPNVAAPQPPNAEMENNKPEETTLATQYGIGGGGRSGGTSPSRSPGQRGRTSSSVGPMRRPADRKHDTSPYGSTVYLSPPPDSNWRRTHSDSALHQSCGGGEQPASPQPLSPHHHPLRSHPHQHMAPHQNHHRADGHLDVLNTMGMNPTNRPRSSCEIPRIPNNNNVYESGGDGGGGGGGGTLGCGELQVPGGSLPDLTSVHFPSPYRASPDYHQPRYSPTSPGGSVSPATGGLSPASGSPVGATVPLSALHHPTSMYDTQNHLSVPNTNNYLHRNKSMSPLDHNWMPSGYQSHCSPPSQYSSTSNINVPSPTGVSPLDQDWMPSGYQSHCSPTSQYSSTSNLNVPSPTMVNSPGSPVESPQTDYSNIHQVLLQPFEQITMLDQPVTSYSTTYMNHSSPHSPQTTNSAHTYPQTSQATSGASGASDSRPRARDPVPGGGGFPPLASPSGPPTPATPASIPDIILTDYSGELDAGMFGGEEAQLRAGLDLDDLSLLEEPGALLPDSAVEHEFRLDRL